MNAPAEKNQWWRLLFNIVETMHSGVDHVDPEFDALTIAQVKVLKLFLTDETGSGMMLKDIASKLKLTPGAASQTVEMLVRSDMLQRETSEIDRRAVEIKLGVKALDLRAKAEKFFAGSLLDAVRDLPEKDLEIFTQVLKHIHKNIKGIE